MTTELQGQAQLCLLVLHLEVRVHCFYHLMPLAKSNYSGAIDDMDADTNVARLKKDLEAIDQVLQQALQPKRFRYNSMNIVTRSLSCFKYISSSYLSESSS